MDVCLCVCMSVCVCMFGHNSGTPGAISTKLGTHMAVRICKHYIYILSSKHHFQQGGWCGRPPCDPPPGVTNRCRGNVYANRYRSNSPIMCVVLEHTYKHASICI
jgi:hypothetical protein